MSTASQVCKVLKLYELARHLPQCALSEFERPGYVEEGQRIMTALRYPVSHPAVRSTCCLSGTIEAPDDRPVF
jgi:hypothetical protein